MTTFCICHKKYLFKTAGDEFFIRQIFAIKSPDLAIFHTKTIHFYQSSRL